MSTRMNGGRTNRRQRQTPPTDEQAPAATRRRTTTALNAAATAPPPPEPETNLALVYTISIYSAAVVDRTGAITRPEKLERVHSGTCRWRSSPGFARFKTAVALEATVFAKDTVTFEDVDVKVEIPGSIYNQRTPCSPVNQANYMDMVHELQRNGGRPGRLVLKWTRPPSQEVDTGNCADVSLPASLSLLYPSRPRGPFLKSIRFSLLEYRNSTLPPPVAGSGITDPLGRDPAVAATDNMALHVAQRVIEARWPVCDCARNGVRDRRCFIDSRRKHWPITAAALAVWKHKLVYDRATADRPPTDFFDNVTARPRGSFASTPAGQAMMASNAHPAGDAADASANSSGVWTDTMDSQDDVDASTESTGAVLGAITNTMKIAAVKRLPPFMTVYHFTQTFQPGSADLVLHLYRHDITYMINLQRVFSGQARVQPEDLGLTPGQLDICEGWLVRWKNLKPELEESGEQAGKDIRHLLQAAQTGSRDVEVASSRATVGDGA